MKFWSKTDLASEYSNPLQPGLMANKTDSETYQYIELDCTNRQLRLLMKKSVDKDQNIVDGYKESESTESSPAAWMAWSEIEDKTDSKQVAFMNLLAKLCTQ